MGTIPSMQAMNYTCHLFLLYHVPSFSVIELMTHEAYKMPILHQNPSNGKFRGIWCAPQTPCCSQVVPTPVPLSLPSLNTKRFGGVCHHNPIPCSYLKDQ